jgi:tetratricopeptide (TPR) repeat protein
LKPSEKIRSDLTAEQQAADLLKNEISSLVEQLITEFPNDMQLIGRATVFYRINREFSKAKKLLEKGLSINPKDRILCNLAADIAYRRGEYEKAANLWRTVLGQSPNKIQLYKKMQLHKNIAQSLIFSGKYTEATKELEQLIAVSPESAVSYSLMGQAYLQLRQYDKAEYYYQKAFELNPNYYSANFGLGKVYMRLNLPEKAKPYLEKCKEKYADLLHDIYSDKSDSGVDTSKSELEKFPGLLAELSVRGSERYLSKDKKESKKLFKGTEKVFQKAISLAPNKPRLYRELAFLYLMFNTKVTEAKVLAQKAVELEESARSYFVLGFAYYKNSDIPNAMLSKKRAMKMDPGNMEYRRDYRNMVIRKN